MDSELEVLGRYNGDTALAKPNGKAAKGARTRTGCLTCRQRRIKCDEGKPRCQNCIPRDRMCIYKEPTDKNERQAPVKLVPQARTKKHKVASAPRNKLAVASPLATPPHVESPSSPSEYRRIKPREYPISSLYEAESPKVVQQQRNGYNSYVESPLLDPENYLAFAHFVQHVAPIMSLIDPSPTEPSIFTIKPGYKGHLNLWSYKLPVLALQYPPLLLALLAIAQLHRSNVGNTPHHEAFVHYHRALKRISLDLSNDREQPFRAVDGTALLTATLTLAFYETWTGNHGAWRRHMVGAAEILRKYAINWTPTAAGPDDSHVDLFFWYAKMDVIQSFLSGEPLLLPLEYWRFPIRAMPDTVLGFSDTLIFLMASCVEFLSHDRIRKEKGAVNELQMQAALHTWSALCAELNLWEQQLDAVHKVREDTNIMSPTGSCALYYDDVRISALRHLALCLRIHLGRGHPDCPAHPRQSIAAAARDTMPIVYELIAHVAGCFRPHNFQPGIMDGSHIIATLYNAAWPLFVAGLQIQDSALRHWLLSTLSTIYELSGWATAVSSQWLELY